MYKAAFECEQLCLIAVDAAVGWQIEVAQLVTQSHNTIVISFVPVAVIEATIAKGKEAFALPSELRYFDGSLSLFVEVHFEFC